MKPSDREYLPFTVSLVSSRQDLDDAVRVRASAFLRHKAPAAESLRAGEPDDERDDVALLIARSKLDGAALGTLRIQPNVRKPMHLQSVIDLPAPYSQGHCAEFIRLGVLNGAGGRLVSFALAKAGYRICRVTGMDYIFLCSRAPVDTMYRRYQFDDFLGGERLELHYAPGVPHTVLCLPVAEAEERWRQRSPAVHRFFVDTEHPDLRVDEAEVRRRFAKPARVEDAEPALAGID